jgi:hypothetical protein
VVVNPTSGVTPATWQPVPPPGAAGVRGLARLIRWKLLHHGKPVRGETTLVSGGGSTNRYPRGQAVRFKRISGHRDAAYTECPGKRLYGQLRNVRRKARRG